VSEEQLRSLLDRVSTPAPPDTTDVEAAIRSGRRDRRARTATAVLSCAAVVAGLTGAGIVLTSTGRTGDRWVAADPSPAASSAGVAVRIPGVGEGFAVTSSTPLVGVWRAVPAQSVHGSPAGVDGGDQPLVSFRADADGRVFGETSGDCDPHSGEVQTSASGRFQVLRRASGDPACPFGPAADNAHALFSADHARIVPAARAAPAFLLLQRRGRVLGIYEQVAAAPGPSPERTVLTSGPDLGPDAGPAVPVTGRLTLGGDGCLGLDGRTAVFPPGSRWSTRLFHLVLPDGSVAAVGDSVTGTGIVMSAEAARQVVGDAPEVGGCRWGDQVRVFGSWASLTVRR